MTPRPLPAWAERLSARIKGGRNVCVVKARYETEVHARAAGRNLLRDGRIAKARLWPYPCVHCRRWHLTSQSNAAAAITAETSHDGVTWA